MKNGFIYLIIGLVAVFLLFNTMKSQSILGSETMTRTIPGTVQPNADFTVIYSASGMSGNWAATIVDSVSGGCLFSGVSAINNYLVSTSGTVKTMTVKAPASGSCTFTGTYQYGDKSINSFQAQTITISTTAPPTYTIDSNGNGVIDSSELLSAITKWINGEITKSNLQTAINSWKGV